MAEQPDLPTYLAQLEAERAELDVTIGRIRRFLMLPDDGNSLPLGATPAPLTAGRDTTITGRVRADEFFRLSQRDAIIKYLSIMKQPQNPMSIVKGLQAGGVLSQAKNFYANVNTELKRMKARDIVVNTASGWGLAEWYPQRSKQNEPAKPAKKKKKSTAHHGKKAKPHPTDGNVDPDKMNWHQFLGAAAKAGKTMEQAAKEWKQRKAASA